MQGKKIKVVVVDDSGLMRLIISDIINSEPDMEVCGVALDGKEAVNVVKKLKPDVVLMDMNMGKYDGLYGVKNILRHYQVPIIILSAIGNTNLEPVIEALRLGAFDYLNKPVENKAKVRLIQRQIIYKIKSAVATNTKHFTPANASIKENNYSHTFSSNLNYHVIVIGASTGGPTAIERIITQLPENLPIPVLIAQHMPANFIQSFTARLNKYTPLEVRVGKLNDVLKAGNIYIAPGDNNMIVKKNMAGEIALGFSNVTYREYNHPSINALMLSVNEIYKDKAIGAILTGMGRDGADGLTSIYNSGGYTIGQDEDSSIVYGMPKEVAQRGVLQKVVAIKDMAGFIVSCLA